MGCVLRSSGMKACKEAQCIATRGLACCYACRFGKESGCNHACEYIAGLWKEEKAKYRRRGHENK